MVLRRTLACTILAALALRPALIPAQTGGQRESPVFKNYKPPEQLPTISQSDPVYQIWQTFLVARKAASGDVLAQHELGLRYLMGIGVEQDTLKAATWIQKAAEQNLIPARFNLAILYYHGWGLPWNPFESYRNFVVCAQNNVVEAEYVLSQFLTENLVVPQDWAAAYGWLKKAADAGYAPAKEALPEFEKRLQAIAKPAAGPLSDSTVNPLAIPVYLNFGTDTAARADGKALLQNVLQNADPETRNALGMSRLLDTGRAVGPAELAAVRKAADAGSPEALAVLGRFYQKGEEVPKDLVVAASYYIRAIRMDSPRAGELLWAIASDKKFVSELKARAAKDDVHAQFSWPTLVALGFGPLLMQNQAYLTDPQAFRMLRKAADRGDTQSMIELGLCYYAGRWVARDEARALLLWQEAAHAGSREAQIRIAVTDVRNGSSSGGDTAAVQMLSRAVTDGSVLAEMALGYCYENGIGVPRVPAEAARLYRAAARRGSQDAYRALKRMYDRIRPADPQYVIAD